MFGLTDPLPDLHKLAHSWSICAMIHPEGLHIQSLEVVNAIEQALEQVASYQLLADDNDNFLDSAPPTGNKETPTLRNAKRYNEPDVKLEANTTDKIAANTDEGTCINMMKDMNV